MPYSHRSLFTRRKEDRGGTSEWREFDYVRFSCYITLSYLLLVHPLSRHVTGSTMLTTGLEDIAYSTYSVRAISAPSMALDLTGCTDLRPHENNFFAYRSSRSINESSKLLFSRIRPGTSSMCLYVPHSVCRRTQTSSLS